MSLIQAILGCMGSGAPEAAKMFSMSNGGNILIAINLNDVALGVQQDNKVLFPNGNKYIGDMKLGQLDGHGVLYYRNGDVYKGEWY